MSLVSFRGTLRRLAQSPGFALAVILTLALSIGANTAVFSLVNALLLRPLPYPQPDRLAGIELHRIRHAPDPTTAIDGETWELIRDQVPQVMSAVSSFGGVTSATNIRTPAGIQSVSFGARLGGFLPVLGELPVMGRSFTPEEDRDGGPHAVVISNQLWRTAVPERSAYPRQGDPGQRRAVHSGGRSWTALLVARGCRDLHSHPSLPHGRG